MKILFYVLKIIWYHPMGGHSQAKRRSKMEMVTPIIMSQKGIINGKIS